MPSRLLTEKKNPVHCGRAKLKVEAAAVDRVEPGKLPGVFGLAALSVPFGGVVLEVHGENLRR